MMRVRSTGAMGGCFEPVSFGLRSELDPNPDPDPEPEPGAESLVVCPFVPLRLFMWEADADAATAVA